MKGNHYHVNHVNIDIKFLFSMNNKYQISKCENADLCPKTSRKCVLHQLTYAFDNEVSSINTYL